MNTVNVGVSSAGFRRAGLVVLVGSIFGFGINLALTPVVSRLFNPETFGSFATLTSVASVFIGVSTLRLEVLSQRTRDENEARDVLRLALLMSCGWGLAITLVGVAAVILVGAGGWWASVGLLVTLASLQLIGTARLTRAQDYRLLAFFNFVQGASIGVIQVILGWAGAGVGALLAGFAAARLIWLGVLGKERLSTRGLREVWGRSRRFAYISGGSALVNSLSGQLPVLLSFLLFGGGSVGLFAMAIRILVSPLGVVGQAAASATIGEVGRRLRDHDPMALSVVRKGARDLFCIGILPCGSAAAFGNWVVPLVLGSQWERTGAILVWLAFGALAQFVVAPFSQLLNLAGRSRWMLAWDVARFVSVAASFGLTSLFGGPFLLAVGLYSAAQVILYVVLARMILVAVRRANA